MNSTLRLLVKNMPDPTVEIENTCEACEQKELCPVYRGQGCLLVKQHKEEILMKERND